MSEDYDNRMSGYLYKNDYKEDGDAKPNYKGKFTDHENNQKEIAAWVRQDRNGKSFLSVKISDLFQKPEQESAPVITEDISDDFLS